MNALPSERFMMFIWIHCRYTDGPFNGPEWAKIVYYILDESAKPIVPSYAKSFFT